MTSSEFVSGAGVARLRRQKSAAHLKKQAEEARNRLSERLTRLADLRMKLLIPWWHEVFPTRQLRVIFGNGAALAFIDGRRVCTVPGLNHEIELPETHKYYRTRGDVRMRDSTLEPLMGALNDVDDITDGLMDANPNDLIIEPVKQRRKRP